MSRLTFHYSCVNAGKSARLLVQAKNLEDRGHDIMIFIPKVCAVGKVSSRLGIERSAIEVRDSTDLVKEMLSSRETSGRFPHTIFVDEAQFLSRDHVLQLTRVVDDLQINVDTYGLRTDFRGDLFEGSKHLLAWADELCEVKTPCSSGGFARFSQRLGDSREQIHIGQEYKPVSRAVFELWRR